MGHVLVPFDPIDGDQAERTEHWCKTLEWPVAERLHAGFTMVEAGVTMPWSGAPVPEGHVAVECFRLTDDELAATLAELKPLKAHPFLVAVTDDNGVAIGRGFVSAEAEQAYRRAEMDDSLARARADLAAAEEGQEWVDAVAGLYEAPHTAAQELLAAANVALTQFSEAEVEAAVVELKKRRPRENDATRAVEQVAARTQNAMILGEERRLAVAAAKAHRRVTVDVEAARLADLEAKLEALH